MADVQHALGPWEIVPSHSLRQIIIREAITSGRYICEISAARGYDLEPTDRANAHLIEVAPDLLAICDEAIAAFENLLRGTGKMCYCGDAGVCTVCKLRAATAKVRGPVMNTDTHTAIPALRAYQSDDGTWSIRHAVTGLRIARDLTEDEAQLFAAAPRLAGDNQELRDMLTRLIPLARAGYDNRTTREGKVEASRLLSDARDVLERLEAQS